MQFQRNKIVKMCTYMEIYATGIHVYTTLRLYIQGLFIVENLPENIHITTSHDRKCEFA